MIVRPVAWLLFAVVGLCAAAAQAVIVDFEDLSPLENPLPENYHYDGVGVEGETDFASHGATFNNTVDPQYFTWGGWAYSNKTETPTTADPEQPNYVYQYSATTGVGSRGSSLYGIAYVEPFTPTIPAITLPAGTRPISMQITNSTYAMLSMLHGDGFTDAFHGPNEQGPGDWLKVTITGLDAANASVGTIDVYLADLRAENPVERFMLDQWTNVNLTSLAGAHTLSFVMSSSDVGEFGINTPTYFAFDDLSLTTQFGDVTDDAVVNGQDIARIASNWLAAGPVADVNGDGIVNGQDIATVASNWLAGAIPTAQGVPEPGTWLLLLVGLALLAGGTKLRK